MRWFKKVAKKLHTGKWDGDIDSLDQQPDPEDWRQVQANAHACNGGQYEYFKSCVFFKAGRHVATATLQVTNHALILVTLQTDSTLIDPGNTLFVLDEAHHLPSIAGDQFTYRARLGTSVKLLSSLRTVAMRHGREMPASALTACGSFDFFDRLSGINRFPERRALVVASPFDYVTQGELRIATMKHSLKSARFPPSCAKRCANCCASTLMGN